VKLGFSRMTVLLGVKLNTKDCTDRIFGKKYIHGSLIGKKGMMTRQAHNNSIILISFQNALCAE